MTASEQLVVHPGNRFWEQLAGELREYAEDCPIGSGEFHVLVRPRVYGTIWHWVSTTLAHTERTSAQLGPDVVSRLQQVTGLSEQDVQGETADADLSESVPWRDVPPPRGTFAVPVAVPIPDTNYNPRVVLHEVDPERTVFLTREYPDAVDMGEADYIVAWISPHFPEELAVTDYRTQGSERRIAEAGAFPEQWLDDSRRWVPDALHRS